MKQTLRVCTHISVQDGAEGNVKNCVCVCVSVYTYPYRMELNETCETGETTYTGAGPRAK